MKETIHLLRGNFTILDLGCANASDIIPKQLRKTVTLIETDPLTTSQTGESEYYKKITLNKAVSETSGRRIFYKRKFSQCASFLEIDPELVKAYGLQDYAEPDGTIELECETIQTLLKMAGTDRLDYIKTDLEGIDYGVLSSAPDVISKALVIQSELRFQPLYKGEPHFHTTLEYLTNFGFEVISMQPWVWKYATENSRLMRDGRIVWGDVLFFLGIEKVKTVFGKLAPMAFVKQIILAKSLGLHNYAEFLYENVKSDMPNTVQNEIKHYLKPPFNFQMILNRTANAVNFLPGGYLILYLINGLASCLAGATALTRLEFLGYLQQFIYRKVTLKTLKRELNYILHGTIAD